MEITDLQLDANGHLSDYKFWNLEVAKVLSENDGFELNKEHWQIIKLVRDIYLETETTPPMRLLIKLMKKEFSEDIANSRYLYRLFPDGPVRLASKYAGLPKPKHCL